MILHSHRLSLVVLLSALAAAGCNMGGDGSTDAGADNVAGDVSSGTGRGEEAGQGLSSDGTADNDQTAVQPGRPGAVQTPGAPCELSSVPFVEEEFWTIISDPLAADQAVFLTISGVGNSVEGIQIITDPFTGDGCTGTDPDATFSFDGQHLSLEAMFSREPTFAGPFDPTIGPIPADPQASDVEEMCSVRLTAAISSCGTRIFFPLPFEVFDLDIEAEIGVAGELFDRPAAVQIMRFRPPQPTPCDDPPTSLPPMGWSLSNSNQTSFFLPPEDGDRVFIDVFGIGDQVDSVSLYAQPFFQDALAEDADLEVLDCSIGRPDGTVTFDGTTLTIDMATAEGCAITFTGTVADCGLYSLGGLFGAGPPTQVIRIEGRGTYSSGATTGEFGTLYLTPELVFPGEDIGLVPPDYNEVFERAPCYDPPTTLIGHVWSLGDVDNSDFAAVSDDDETLILDVSGSDDVADRAGVFTAGGSRADRNCFADALVGPVSFDGSSFAINVSGSATDMSIRFTGTVAECTSFVPDGPITVPGGPDMLRIEGQGSYSCGPVHKDLTAVILSVFESFNDGGNGTGG